jgi:CheY-like chemotaxis protein
MATPTEAAIVAASQKSGMQTLRASAIIKAHAGVTTYEEVLRVTQVDAADGEHCVACGGTVQEGMRACPWCTAAIADDRCPTCTKQVDAAWRMCPWCCTPVVGRGPVPPIDAIDDEGSALPQLLVIDDDESILSYVRAALAGVVDVETATTASAGLELIGSKAFDGALVDQRLPDLTGVELIRLLRSEASTAALPVLLFTGDSTAELMSAASVAGGDGTLIKPVDATMLEERILALVSNSARPGGRGRGC